MKNKGKEMITKTTGVSRRDFLKTSALLGGSATFAACSSASNNTGNVSDYELNNVDNVIYSVCLQCHTSCPIKVKLGNGTAVKIDGNPYSIQTMSPHIPYKTDIENGAKIDGGICPKGQAGLETLYDPYRLVKVIKRDGKRGENKWKVIDFDKAITEIVEGGKLFSNVPGEENRVVEGLKDIYKLRDSKLSKKMSEDAKSVSKGKMSVKDFRNKYSKHLDKLINPDHPDFGPKNNQFVFQAGRIEHGRDEFAKRWLIGGFGSKNWFNHTTICEQSHHIAYNEITNKYIGNGKWSGGKHHLKPDLYNSEFVIFFGTSVVEANFGPPFLSNLLTDAIAKEKLKVVVVDPRFSKTAAKAWKWLPVRPGGDAALAYGIILWMLDNGKFDKEYLISANKAAAKAKNETTWTNATHLVRIEKDGPGSLLRGSDIGKGSSDHFVAIVNGKPAAFKANDDKNPVNAELFYSGEINGIKVKTALQLLYDYARQKTLSQWAKESGLEEKDIIAVAKEFAKHGKKSVADLYRGPVQHTSGYYNGQVIISLNMLVGNVDWKGGLSVGGGHWHEDGSKPGNAFPVVKKMHPNKLAAFGIKLTREKSNYENSTLFRENGYPAKRPWFPHTGNVYQEIIPSAQDGYPYSIKALMFHKGTPVFSSPAGHKMIEALVDTKAIPLIIASDIVIGETSMFADYIFPDTAIWERWGTPHTTPVSPVASSKVRQPTIEPLTEKVSVFGEEMHCSMEAVMLAIAEKLNLPGYGKDGFAPGMDFTRDIDFYLKMIANISSGDKPGDMVPEATPEEMKIFRKARKHLSKTVFDEVRFSKAVVDLKGNNWFKRVVHILNRGGRFEDFDKYRNSGDKLPHQIKRQMNFYSENVAKSRHSFTGKRFSGIGLYEPVKAYDGMVVNQEGFKLSLITYKEIVGGQSRTIAPDYWLSAILPENPIIINTETANKLGLKEGDEVKIVSSTNKEGFWDLKNGTKIPIKGKVRVKQGMRPGVVGISWSYGHWAYGSNDIYLDGSFVKGDETRRRGLCPNAAMEADPILKNVTLQDIIGGSASYYDSKVNLVKLT